MTLTAVWPSCHRHLGQKKRRRCVSLGVAAVYWPPVMVDSPLGETVSEMRLLKVFVSVEVVFV